MQSNIFITNSAKTIDISRFACEQKQFQDDWNRALAHGIGGELAKKYDMYHRLESNGCAAAINPLANILLQGNVAISKDRARAKSLYECAASLSSKQYPAIVFEANMKLGLAYLEDKEYQSAHPCLLKAAEAGDPNAMYFVGLMFLNGEGTLKSEEAGMEWLRKSAGKDHPLALDALGMEYFRQGDGQSALLYLDKSFERGWHESQVNAGQLYLTGQSGIQKDSGKAYACFVKAAQNGSINGMLKASAICLKNDNGMPDSLKAAYWLQQAVKKGDAAASYLLGEMTLRGDGVVKDLQKGFQMMVESANQGNKSALYRLVRMYEANESDAKTYITPAQQARFLQALARNS